MSRVPKDALPPGDAAGLSGRVRGSLERLVGGPLHEAGPVVVALSGGLDSMVLTHLLRFRVHPRPTVVLAHYDHAMRRDSAADACWLRGLARAWGIPLRTARAVEPPGSEAAARSARYAFLRDVVADVGARWLLTGHHADDQAETVLFRVLRGTGSDGLRGMDASRPFEGGAWLLRPLLDVWREELEGYAAAVGLCWREDPTNLDGGYARNVIRRELLPLAEDRVAPGARRALVRLSGVVRDEADAWAEILPRLLADLGWDGRSLDAAEVEVLGPALRARVLRHVAREAGLVLDHRTTTRAADFVAGAVSGRGVELGEGFELRRELDRLLVLSGRTQTEDQPVVIPDAGPGGGTARLGGRRLRVRWAPRERGSEGAVADAGEPDRQGGGAAFEDEIVLRLPGPAFPLVVRGRRPGDRIDVWGGSRRVKRLLQDARVPSLERAGVPVVVDAAGRIVWIPGVAEWVGATPEAVEGEGGAAPSRAADAISITVSEE